MEKKYILKFSSLDGIDEHQAKKILSDKFNMDKAENFMQGKVQFKPMEEDKIDKVIAWFSSKGIKCDKFDFNTNLKVTDIKDKPDDIIEVPNKTKPVIENVKVTPVLTEECKTSYEKIKNAYLVGGILAANFLKTSYKKTKNSYLVGGILAATFISIVGYFSGYNPLVIENIAVKTKPSTVSSIAVKTKENAKPTESKDTVEIRSALINGINGSENERYQWVSNNYASNIRLNSYATYNLSDYFRSKKFSNARMPFINYAENYSSLSLLSQQYDVYKADKVACVRYTFTMTEHAKYLYRYTGDPGRVFSGAFIRVSNSWVAFDLNIEDSKSDRWCRKFIKYLLLSNSVEL